MTRNRSTPAPPTGRALSKLVRRCGIQRRYVDGTGQRRSASIEAVLAVLRAMGLDVARPQDAERELSRLEAAVAERLCEPVVVHWIGSNAPVSLGRGAASIDAVDIRLVTEGGGDIRWRASRADLLGADRGGGPGLTLPAETPAGVHRLILMHRDRTDEATLLAAPPQCYRPDRASATDLGIFLPLYAARSETCLGIGSIGELARLTRWARQTGARVVGTLPLLTTFLDDPFEPSPYVPVSRSVFGELFIDLHDAAARFPLPEMREVLASTSFTAEAARLRSEPLVDYRRSWALVRQGLEAATRDAFASELLRAEIEAIVNRDPLIGEYVRFRSTGAGRAETTPRRIEDERRFFLCAQWLLADQLRYLSGGSRPGDRSLYLDLPIGSHAKGFDAWRNPGLYATGASLGAPPDGLFAGGQTWGFPPVMPAASRAIGHREFATAVARHLEHAEALRIDHAAGLFRCFWVPDGFPATEGVYVRTPAEELLAVLSIVSHRHQSIIIAENLGTVPDEVNRGLRRRGVLGMSIGQFDLGCGEEPLPTPAPDSLVALNTHDTPTFAAHWAGSDIDVNVRFGVKEHDEAERLRRDRDHQRGRVIDALRGQGWLDGGDPSARRVLEALLRYLADTTPRVLLINLEDVWLEPEPQNIPGVVEYPNWRRKASRTLDRILGDDTIESLLRRLGGGHV